MDTVRKAILLLFFSAIQLAVFSQLKPVYNFWKDDSLVKKAYYDQAKQHQEKLVNSLSGEYKKEYKEIYESRFKNVTGLLKSDRIVTAPEPHQYLQAILEKITDANEELRSLDIRMVFSLDSWPNAYSIGEGTLVVNAGLMIFLDNESELVFALCHELAHYYLDHGNKSVKKYVAWRNSDELKKEIRRLSKEEFKINKQINDLLKKLTFGERQHSRDFETEADRQAFQFMKKTGYDCGGIKTCLQLLDNIDDSLIYKPCDPEKDFNFREYPFKKKWIQKESELFILMKEDDSPLSQKEKDSLKTHPDCARRVVMLEDSVTKNSGGKKFLVNEDIFNRLKKDFYVEMTEQEFRDENLGLNLYYSLLMLQAGENMPVAIYSIARDLNRAYDGRKNHTLGNMFSAESRRLPQDYNLLLRMLSRLRLEEIAALGYYFCNQYRDQMIGYAGFGEEMEKAIKRFN